MNNQLELDSLKRDWIDDVVTRLPSLYRGRQFTSDDIYEHFYAPGQPNWVGAAVAVLRNRGILKPVGFRVSKRPSANGRTIRVWECVLI